MITPTQRIRIMGDYDQASGAIAYAVADLLSAAGTVEQVASQRGTLELLKAHTKDLESAIEAAEKAV